MFINEINSLPEYIPQSTYMELPNQEIPIYEGEFTIQQNEISIVVIGKIVFKWYPELGPVFVTTELISESHAIITLNMSEHCNLFIAGFLFGKAYIMNIVDMHFLSGRCVQGKMGDTSIKVSSIRFSIPNLQLFDGEKIKKTGENKISFFNGRNIFDNGFYRITIDEVENSEKVQRNLQQTGGYLVTCGGEIVKNNGSLSLNEVEELLLAFNTFLCFLNGRRTSLFFLKGIFEEEIIWSDYSGYICDPYKSVKRWARVDNYSGLNGIWQKFSDMFKDSDKKDFLLYAIHWYSEANSSSGSTDGSIIFAQTSLELFYNWLLIEQRKLIIGSDANGLSAANKIRLLLSQISLTTVIPSGLSSLVAIKDIEDGPEIFTIIRNALVHGQEKKRKDLRDISTLAKYEALELGLWYLELCMLYVLEYRGSYSNRTLKNSWFGYSETVPWQKTD